MLSDSWCKSSQTIGGIGCLEVKLDGDNVVIRDDKNPLFFVTTDRTSWIAFLEGAKRGEFDLFN